MSKVSVLFAAAVLVIGTARASTVTITNTFVSGQTPPAGGPGPAAPLFGASGTDANGLHALGVTFSFSDPANEVYGASVTQPPINQGLQGPGDTTITLAFDLPSTFLSFDIVFAPLVTPTVFVTIDGTTSSFATTSGSPFGKGSFSSGTLSPFLTAQISFDDSAAPEGVFYAIGNLSYDAPGSTPEPGSMTLLGAGAVLLGTLLRARRSSGCASSRF